MATKLKREPNKQNTLPASVEMLFSDSAHLWREGRGITKSIPCLENSMLSYILTGEKLKRKKVRLLGRSTEKAGVSKTRTCVCIKVQGRERDNDSLRKDAQQ